MEVKEETFEANLKRLEEIVAALEAPDVPLERGMELFKEGMKLSRVCRERLAKARQELEVWREGEIRELDPEALKNGDFGESPF